VHEFQLNGRQARRIVLGDWDSQAWILQVDRQGFRLEPVAI
jgi:UDP-2,3-diacylglucosamine hydrolase